jgi:hypothetical protein
VGEKVGLRDLVHPGPDNLTEDLTAGFTPDRLGDHSYGVLRLDEAK